MFKDLNPRASQISDEFLIYLMSIVERHGHVPMVLELMEDLLEMSEEVNVFLKKRIFTLMVDKRFKRQFEVPHCLSVDLCGGSQPRAHRQAARAGGSAEEARVP